jgi:hypothetical protein
MNIKKKHKRKKDVEYFTIKCKLKNIFNDPFWIPLVKGRVDMVNKIWLESYFFFNQHILRLLKENKEIIFDYKTLERCVLFVLNKFNTIRDLDNEYLDLIDTYVNYYEKLGLNKVSEFNNIKSIKKPNSTSTVSLRSAHFIRNYNNGFIIINLLYFFLLSGNHKGCKLV